MHCPWETRALRARTKFIEVRRMPPEVLSLVRFAHRDPHTPKPRT